MPSVEDKVMHFYTKGLSTREIADTLKELYDADVSPTLISNITDAVIDKVIEWQSRSLDAVYPIVYLDCIVLKIRQAPRKDKITKKNFFGKCNSSIRLMSVMFV